MRSFFQKATACLLLDFYERSDDFRHFVDAGFQAFGGEGQRVEIAAGFGVDVEFEGFAGEGDLAGDGFAAGFGLGGAAARATGSRGNTGATTIAAPSLDKKLRREE